MFSAVRSALPQKPAPEREDRQLAGLWSPGSGPRAKYVLANRKDKRKDNSRSLRDDNKETIH